MKCPYCDTGKMLPSLFRAPFRYGTFKTKLISHSSECNVCKAWVTSTEQFNKNQKMIDAIRKARPASYASR